MRLNFRIIFISGILLLFISCNCEASKHSKVKKGKEAYENKNYVGALKNFESAFSEDNNSDIINFDLGSAQYKNGKYDDAIYSFKNALLGEDDNLKEKVYYNLGNSLYKKGAEKEDTNPEMSVEILKKSAKKFEDALQINKEDEDAKTNHAFVLKEIERIKKKIKQQKNNKSSQNNKNKNKQKNQKQNKQQNSQQQKNKQQNQKQSQQSHQQQKQQTQQQQSSQQQKEKKQENKQQGQSNNKDKKDNKTNKSSSENNKQMTQEQAKMMIRSYQQSEEPKGMLNLSTQYIKPRDVEKDW